MFLYKIESKLIISRSRTVWKIKLRSFKNSLLSHLKFTKYFTLSPSDISAGKRKLQIRNWRLKTNRRNANERYYFSYFGKIFSWFLSFHLSLILSVSLSQDCVYSCLCQWYLSSGSEILNPGLSFVKMQFIPERRLLCSTLSLKSNTNQELLQNIPPLGLKINLAK